MRHLQTRGCREDPHFSARTLWLQKLVKNGVLTIETVAGTENMADLGTKILNRKKLVTLRAACGQAATDEPNEDALVQAVQPRSHLMGVAGGKVLQALIVLMNAIHADGKRGSETMR